jgi:hypothetical protein
MNSPQCFAPSFVEKLMQDFAPEKSIHVQSVSRFEVDNSASILAVLTSAQSEKLIGHFGLRVEYTENGMTKAQNMVMKIKPHGSEITTMLNGLAQACGGGLAQIYPQFQTQTGFRHTHVREQEIYQRLPSSLTPTIFGVYADDAEAVYLILMEYLEEVTLLNAVMNPAAFSDAHIKTALAQMAIRHHQNMREALPLNRGFWQDCPSKAYMQTLTPLWEALLKNASQNFPELYSLERTKQLKQAIQNIPDYWQELEKMPQTLIHNDLNPRNTCYKTIEGQLQFCVYDWELATFHVPQYDVVEFLCFVLDESRYSLREAYLEYYRTVLCQLDDRFADTQAFKRGFELAALDFGLHRLGMYMMAHTVDPYPFLPRVVNSYFEMLGNSQVLF